mgnify:FL=1
MTDEQARGIAILLGVLVSLQQGFRLAGYDGIVKMIDGAMDDAAERGLGDIISLARTADLLTRIETTRS